MKTDEIIGIAEKGYYEEAMEEAISLESGDERDRLISDIAIMLADERPALAMLYSCEIECEAERDRAVEGILMKEEEILSSANEAEKTIIK